MKRPPGRPIDAVMLSIVIVSEVLAGASTATHRLKMKYGPFFQDRLSSDQRVHHDLYAMGRTVRIAIPAKHPVRVLDIHREMNGGQSTINEDDLKSAPNQAGKRSRILCIQ